MNKFSPEPVEGLAIGGGGDGVWVVETISWSGHISSVVLAFNWWFLVSGPMSQN